MQQQHSGDICENICRNATDFDEKTFYDALPSKVSRDLRKLLWGRYKDSLNTVRCLANYKKDSTADGGLMARSPEQNSSFVGIGGTLRPNTSLSTLPLCQMSMTKSTVTTENLQEQQHVGPQRDRKLPEGIPDQYKRTESYQQQEEESRLKHQANLASSRLQNKYPQQNIQPCIIQVSASSGNTPMVLPTANKHQLVQTVPLRRWVLQPQMYMSSVPVCQQACAHASVPIRYLHNPKQQQQQQQQPQQQQPQLNHLHKRNFISQNVNNIRSHTPPPKRAYIIGPTMQYQSKPALSIHPFQQRVPQMHPSGQQQQQPYSSTIAPLHAQPVMMIDQNQHVGRNIQYPFSPRNQSCYSTYAPQIQRHFQYTGQHMQEHGNRQILTYINRHQLDLQQQVQQQMQHEQQRQTERHKRSIQQEELSSVQQLKSQQKQAAQKPVKFTQVRQRSMSRQHKQQPQQQQTIGAYPKQEVGAIAGTYQPSARNNHHYQPTICHASSQVPTVNQFYHTSRTSSAHSLASNPNTPQAPLPQLSSSKQTLQQNYINKDHHLINTSLEDTRFRSENN